VIVGCGLTFLAYLAVSLGAALGLSYALLAVLPAILLWGFASWGLITAQQARLVALAPTLAAVSLSLNSSAIYLGSAMGAAVGALVIADGAVGRLGWVAAGFSLAALLTVLASTAARQVEVGAVREDRGRQGERPKAGRRASGEALRKNELRDERPFCLPDHTALVRQTPGPLATLFIADAQRCQGLDDFGGDRAAVRSASGRLQPERPAHAGIPLVES
jgi:MFS family permease